MHLLEGFGFDLPTEAKASGREEKLPCDQAWRFSPKGWGLCKLRTVFALSHLFGLLFGLLFISSSGNNGWNSVKQRGHWDVPVASLTCLFVSGYTNLHPKYKFLCMAGSRKAIWKHLLQWIADADIYKFCLRAKGKRPRAWEVPQIV